MLRLVSGCLLAISVGVSATEFPEVQLTNDNVELSVYLPDVKAGSYRSVRFD